MIPFSDPLASYQVHKKEIDQAIERVHNSGWFVLGKEVEAFEQEFASFHGSNYHAVGVANGTDAIALCLRITGMGGNNEVITASHTAVATVAGIEQAGCIPVFADIDPVTRCIDPRSIEKRISDKTRAIMPVHIYGQPCDMNAICKIAEANKLQVIEDCSQAHGAKINEQKVGTFGSLAAFSCYPTKNLGGTGDGGVILCKSLQLGEKLKALRQYGWNKDRESITKGFNSRLDEVQAAILRVKLAHLGTSNKKRLMIANKYYEAFQDLPLTLPHLGKNEMHAMHLFVIECDRRDELLTHLRNSGVGASLHYPLPVHLHAAYSRRIRGSEDLPTTEMFYKNHLTLPMFPELSEDAIENIISRVYKFFKN
jgi:dTDP-4-amino-4,6-dideoxygalactose transaminase